MRFYTVFLLLVFLLVFPTLLDSLYFSIVGKPNGITPKTSNALWWFGLGVASWAMLLGYFLFTQVYKPVRKRFKVGRILKIGCLRTGVIREISLVAVETNTVWVKFMIQFNNLNQQAVLLSHTVKMDTEQYSRFQPRQTMSIYLDPDLQYPYLVMSFDCSKQLIKNPVAFFWKGMALLLYGGALLWFYKLQQEDKQQLYLLYLEYPWIILSWLVLWITIGRSILQKSYKRGFRKSKKYYTILLKGVRATAKVLHREQKKSRNRGDYKQIYTIAFVDANYQRQEVKLVAPSAWNVWEGAQPSPKKILYLKSNPQMVIFDEKML